LRKEQEQLTLVFIPLISIDAQHYGGGTASLRDDQGLLPTSDAAKNSRGVLSKISDGNDFRDLAHSAYIQTYV
jgi:hypothetical protein